MPLIELILPGEPKAAELPVADGYRITIERSDGVACSSSEAQTVMSMYCIGELEQKTKRRKKQGA